MNVGSDRWEHNEGKHDDDLRVPHFDAGPGSVSSLRLIVLLLVMTGLFIAVVGYAIARWRSTAGHPLRWASYSSPWIRAAGSPAHAGYFRKRFDLTSEVKHAWLKIAATDAFEVSVNRNPLGHVYLWRPTRPFQNGTSERGQVLTPKNPAMALNFPREYQWDGHDTWRMPLYLELTSSLGPGKNIIAIEIESRLAPARVSFVGEIQLWNGEVIPIHSDDSWLGEPVILGPQLLDWTEPFYWDKQWRNALPVEGPAEFGRRSLPEEIYTESFDGQWVRHPTASSSNAVTFQTNWTLDTPVDEAWIRLLANRRYELLINGRRVQVASLRPPDLDNGDWVFGRNSALDPSRKPELLDPDEVGSIFVGQQFENPRTADSDLGMFRNPFSPQITPFRYERTYNRAQAPGEIEPKRTLAESRRTPRTPELFPERLLPNSLKHDLSIGGYLSYSVASLLEVGKNTIEIRCLQKSQANWPAQIAIDGGAKSKSGERLDFMADQDWMAMTNRSETSFDADSVPLASSIDEPNFVPVQLIGPALHSGGKIPRMQYRGIALSPARFGEILPIAILQTAGITILSILLMLVAVAYLDWRRQQDPQHAAGVEWRQWRRLCRLLYATMLTATVTVGAGLLLECAWAERHEILWFHDGTMWKVIFPVAIFISLGVAVVDLLGGIELNQLRQQGHVVFGKFRRLPDSRLWVHLIIWVLLLGVLTRGYKIDLQPLDDDEYASTQAILAILETGRPGFVPDDVYYTRSPVFHYVTAAIAWPFGGDLWSLRLQSVGWSIATAWLVYLCGARLLKSRWVGFISMLLLCVHPFEVFTGHVIRFYQMQQFLALLTMYLFCRGFVTNQCQKFRVATLFAFLVAVLSQEITIAMGPSLVFGYLVFSRDLGWTKNIQLGLVSGVVIACIGLDYIVFQTLCLTRTEGVSPVIEAAVKPHFWYPQNLLSLFIGYSRLHVVPTFFLICGLPLLWRERNHNALALVAFLISGVLMTNLLVTNVSLRYMYWLFPVWILLSVDGLRLVLSTLVSVVYPPERHLNRYVVTLSVSCTICITCILASWSLWRMPGSYEMRILGDSTGAVRWIHSQKRPGDRIAITEPHTHCAYLEAGKCDYDIAIPLLYDFAVVRDGILVDRNGGGEVISSLDQMIEVFGRGERVWIALNREKFRTRGKNMRWEYPGARFEKFIRKNCELKHRTYLWSVYLWDPARGHYQSFGLQE